METNSQPLDSLLASAVQYVKTSGELFRMKSVDKTADVASTILSRAVLALVLSLFAMTLTIAVSFWLGELLGKTYYGFLLTAMVYALVATVLFFCHPLIKRRVGDSIITNMLK
jgi:ABC-type dipeptide/oligopeptide/nickel transport system permease component